MFDEVATEGEQNLEIAKGKGVRKARANIVEHRGTAIDSRERYLGW